MLGVFEDIVCMVEEFADGEVADNVREDDRYPDVPFRQGLYDKCRDVGFLTMLLPEEAGGTGESPAALAEVLYELSKVDASVPAVFLCQAFGHSVLVNAGKTELAPAGALIAGPVYDDPLDLPTGVTAEQDGVCWRLSGSLDSFALAPVAGAFLIPAVADGDPALFLVNGTEGVKVGDPLLTLGLRACPVADLEMESAVGAPVASGEDANTVYAKTVAAMRGPAAAVSAGIIAGSLAEGLEYCRERYQGYKQIIDHQQVRAELGRMVAESEAARELFRAACADGGSEMLGAAAQFVAGEMAARATTDGVQVLGGNGYTQEYGQEKRMRDAKQVQCFFGCRELILQDLTAAALSAPFH